MITVITGLPGNGKTLYAIAWTVDQAKKPVDPEKPGKPLFDGGPYRPVFYSGIKDVTLPGWTEFDAEKWYELAPGSIVLIDEVQRVMRPRIHGTKVPEFIAALETHRHLGIDLVLITQHPMLIDANVRRLAGQHFHIIRKFGTTAATIHEWGQVKENADKSRTDSIKHSWVYPTALFKAYKSAEVHTHKRRIPMRVWFLLSLPLILGAIVWYTYHRLMNKEKGPIVNAFTGQVAASSPAGGGGSGVKMTRAAYLEQFVPRVTGLAYTAPVYDEITKPVVAPYPAACAATDGGWTKTGLSDGSATPSRCQCYTQQGTKLETPLELCKSIVAGGFFVAWAQPLPPPPAQMPVKAPEKPVDDRQPIVAGFGRSYVPQKSSASILPQSETEALPPGRGRNLPAPSSRPN